MPKTLSTDEIEEFRARLLAVAQHRFGTEGPGAVTMRQLAESLGCSPMTPYRYFRDKDEILAAVRTAAFERFADALERAAGRSPGDLRSSAAVGEAYVRHALKEPDAYRLMFDVTQPEPDRYPELLRARARARRTMSSYPERLVAAGIFHGDPELVGYAFWAAMHGLVMLHFAGKLTAKRGVEAIRREIARLLVAGATRPDGDAGDAPRPRPRRARRARPGGD